jgi:predicted Zn-dependent protease with MMP-like domain
VEEKDVSAHAYYGLGLCAEEKEDEGAKREAWLRVYDLDVASEIKGPRLTEAEMAEVAESALAELPAKGRELLANVPILIAELPSRDEVEKGLDPRLLGLFEGAAHGETMTLGGDSQLTRILLFRKNLERVAIDADDLREQVRITLIHETGHFFGLSEAQLAEFGLE